MSRVEAVFTGVMVGFTVISTLVNVGLFLDIQRMRRERIRRERRE
jgi:hypothetical protein